MIYVSDIINKIEIADFSGNKNQVLSKITELNTGEIDNESLFWCSDKNVQLLEKINSGTGIISQKTFDAYYSTDKNNSLNFIVVENPRRTFMEILKIFFVEKKKFGNVSDSAKIHHSAQFNPSKVNIGHNVIIESNTVIGDYSEINHNSVIGKSTIIGNNVIIGANTTIGGSGFGYEMDDNQEYQLIPHIGNVVIKNNVEIGNNTCIDRGVIGSTILEENVKIDNLVHISHGVQIGKNSLIIANSMIAGSVEIGENVWIAPSSSIIQKTKINNNALIGMGSVVLKDVKSNCTVAGVPAKELS